MFCTKHIYCDQLERKDGKFWLVTLIAGLLFSKNDVSCLVSTLCRKLGIFRVYFRFSVSPFPLYFSFEFHTNFIQDLSTFKQRDGGVGVVEHPVE